MDKLQQLYIKPSALANLMGVHYRTIIRWFKEGKLEGQQDPITKTILLKNPFVTNPLTDKANSTKAILYARVSSSVNKNSLDGQIDRLRQFATAKGYTIVGEYKELASGINDSRKKLHEIFDRDDFDVLVVEHKDRLTRFGFNYIKKICSLKGVVINNCFYK